MDIRTKATASKAWFSDCRDYRYTLVRTLTQNPGTINFIMLNPSTANEEFNDPTVERCERMAFRLGFGTMAVTNIFAYRATDPKKMRERAERAIGEHNDSAIHTTARDAQMVICAWGNHGDFLDRGHQVLAMLRKEHITCHALKLNGSSGQPGHPLYLRKDLVPFTF